MMGCMWFTRHVPLIISIDVDGEVCMRIDGAHAIHADGKGHSGMFVTMGREDMINVSKKLGLVTTSSTETDVMSNGERFPKFTWFRCFRLAQGDDAEEDVLLQDNKSCITLHKNCPFSVGKGSKHVNVRYFFPVDKMEKKEVRMACCPMKKMIADYSSKPTQGSMFICQRNIIQGVKQEDFPTYKE